MKRAKVQELPEMEGPGVGPVKDKVLDKLGDEFIETRDRKAELATEITAIETKILERMEEKGITNYRFGDQEMIKKPGATHVKIKTVKVGSNGDSNGAEEEGEE